MNYSTNWIEYLYAPILLQLWADMNQNYIFSNFLTTLYVISSVQQEYEMQW
jgi:hypothetical protein